MDPRFSRLATDPRFRKPKQRKLKVEVDDRFKDVLTGEGAFSSGGKKGKKLDKYGRPLANSHDADQLKHFYRLRSPSPDAEGVKGESAASAFVDYARGEGVLESSGSEDEDDDGEPDSSDDDEEVVIQDADKRRKRAIPGRDSSSDDDSDEDDEDSDHLAINLDEDSDAEVPVISKKGNKQSAFPTEEEIAASTAQPADGLDEAEDESRIDPTRRIAVVNMDWDHLRAADLFAVFRSVLTLAKDPAAQRKREAMAARSGRKAAKQTDEGPVHGEVLSVRIYPSEFGKERMKREDMEGPAAEVFGGPKSHKKGKKEVVLGGPRSKGKAKGRAREQAEEDSNDDEEEEEEEGEENGASFEGFASSSEQFEDEEVDSGDDDEFASGGEEEQDDSEESGSSAEDDGEEEVDMDKLRAYQLERLRYYYAVATFSTASASACVFRECNGTEFERTANVFDLSYVPEDMSFEDDEVEDEATEELKGYKGNDFVTDALRHSRVKLTWDQDDPNRSKVLRRPLTKQEIEEEDFRAYLASSSDEEEENKGAKAAKDRTERLRQLLLSGGDETEDVWGKKLPDMRDDDDGPGDMEITFTPGLSKAPSTAQVDDEDLTTLERYQRRMKEKQARKKEKKELKQKMREEKPDKQEQDDFFGGDDEDEVEEEAAPKALENEPELDVDDDAKHFSLQDILKAEKDAGKKKRKRTRKGKQDREVQLGDEGFKVDVADPRFAAIHEEPAFAIDPSNPAFVKTKGMQDLLQERTRRRGGEKTRAPIRQNGADSNSEPSLQDLAASVKRNMEGGEASGAGRKRRRRH